jgi:hypothetical protein
MMCCCASSAPSCTEAMALAIRLEALRTAHERAYQGYPGFSEYFREIAKRQSERSPLFP